jgi:SAP domain
LFSLSLLLIQVAELRELLKLRGLNSVGNKQELVDRLSQAAVSESSGELDKFEDDLLNVRLEMFVFR